MRSTTKVLGELGATFPELVKMSVWAGQRCDRVADRSGGVGSPRLSEPAYRTICAARRSKETFRTPRASWVESNRPQAAFGSEDRSMNVMTVALLLELLAVTASAQEPSAQAANHEPTLDAYIAQSAKGVNFYSLARERELGRRAAADLERALPVVHEPKLDAYIAQLGATLAKYANSPFNYTFPVYEDRRPSREAAGTVGLMPIDAFQGQAGEPVAVAGGPIFIPLSLLAAAPNEAVFAFQLAHAMAHIALRHATKQATRTELTGLDATPSWGAQNTPVADRRPTAVPMGMLQFSRSFERQADYVALLIVSQAGYSPESMAVYLSGQPVPVRAPERAAAVFSAHPPPIERSKAIRAKFESLPAATYTAATGVFAEASAIAARVH
jgi:predicted Zn-dependent protease